MAIDLISDLKGERHVDRDVLRRPVEAVSG
jgi:hypothetical protein